MPGAPRYRRALGRRRAPPASEGPPALLLYLHHLAPTGAPHNGAARRIRGGGTCAVDGAVEPAAFGNLTFLQMLKLSYDWFRGEVPATIDRLAHLQVLDLSYNAFSGEVNLMLAAYLLEQKQLVSSLSPQW